LRNTDMSRLAQVRAARGGASGSPSETVQEAENIEGRKVLTAYAPVAPLGWLVFVELPADEAYAPLYAALQRLGLILLAALGFAVLAGMLLAGRMVGPIRALRAGAARIGSGDLSQRIAIKTGDELEALGLPSSSGQACDGGSRDYWRAGRVQRASARIWRAVSDP
jgi:methyl-accepting chemotaxis protein